VCRATLVAWSSGSRFQLFSYEIKAKEVGFPWQPPDLDSDTRRLRNEENGRAVS
jgi:hypothetical protein